jgi:leucyl/phenylalanyl-tRNA--protein transferase
VRSLPWLDPQVQGFPDPERALREPNGLLAIGGDLSPERVLRAYREGIFPWYEDPQPILWWSPDPRAVLYPDQFHLSRSLRKAIRSGGFRVTLDQHFAEVIHHCGQLRQYREGTWITPDMHQAYQTLHDQGFAHSVEILRDNTLVGGLYGLALGSVFFGESMFSLETNASKIALWYLTYILQQHNFHMIDCQVESEHLTSMGAVCLARTQYIDCLKTYAQPPDPVGTWSLATPHGTLDQLL